MENMKAKIKMHQTPKSADDMPPEVILLIFMRLRGKYDRLQMSFMNRIWRSVYIQNLHMFPEELPWLLMPSTKSPLLHSTSTEMTHKFNLPPEIKKEGCFCGSCEGRWVVLVMENSGHHSLYNLNNRQEVPMPDTIVVRKEMVHIRIIAAAVGDKRSVVTAIVQEIKKDSGSFMVYWRHGSEHWQEVDSPQNRSVDVLDVLYHKHRQSFIYLNVHEVTPVFNDNADLTMEYTDLNVRGSRYMLKLMKAECISHWQYLAEWGNEILRVVKSPNEEMRTRNMTIYKLCIDVVQGSDEEENSGASDGDDDEEEEEEEQEQDLSHDVHWSHLSDLGGRTLFVGQACSRIFENDDKFQDHVMFLDDRRVRIPEGPDWFDRSDMGMFSIESSAVRQWPCGGGGGENIPVASDKCPPIWLYH